MITVHARRATLKPDLAAGEVHAGPHVPWVALPSLSAFRQWVIVRNPDNGRFMPALVLDVRPHYIGDDAYVFGGERPRAESGTDDEGEPCDTAAIELGPKVWATLDYKEDGPCEWGFLELAAAEEFIARDRENARRGP